MLFLALVWLLLGTCGLGACLLSGRSERQAEGIATTQSAPKELVIRKAA